MQLQTYLDDILVEGFTHPTMEVGSFISANEKEEKTMGERIDDLI